MKMCNDEIYHFAKDLEDKGYLLLDDYDNLIDSVMINPNLSPMYKISMIEFLEKQVTRVSHNLEILK